MSRTHRGSKDWRWEYWSRRPLCGYNPSKENKVITHQIERAQEKELLQDEIREMENDKSDDDV